MARPSWYLPSSGEAWWKARMCALVRDEFQCQHAGCTETRLRWLEVHHIKPRIQGGTHDLANLVTLCRKHHADQHPHMRYERFMKAKEMPDDDDKRSFPLPEREL
ncbi:HNH endonuclease [Anaerolineales bacterium HSG6]|nr:HNH endonuclease [Anaerolineales bacterium HSG6]